tara:strand:+ start:88 stop:306 length:219 start_codon:yes stop_codon:yes gene_type:complete
MFRGWKGENPLKINEIEWCSRRDSNAELGIRNPLFYPVKLRELGGLLGFEGMNLIQITISDVGSESSRLHGH